MARQNVITLRLANGTDVQAVKGSRLADIYVARGARELTDKGNPRKAPDVNPLLEPSQAKADAGKGYLALAAETVHMPPDPNTTGD